MCETVNNNSERNIAEEIHTTSRFMASSFLKNFLDLMINLCFQITPEPEIHWSEVEDRGGHETAMLYER